MSRQLGWQQYQPPELEPEESSPQLQEDPPAPAGVVAAEDLYQPAATQPPYQPEPTQPAAARTVPLGPPLGYRLSELLWLCVAVVDIFLALDFLFHALGSNASGFVHVVIRVGNVLASPFVGIFAGRSVPSVGHSTFWAAGVAVVVYTLAAWLLIRLIRVLVGPAYRRPPSP